MKIKTTILKSYDNTELKDVCYQSTSFPHHFHDTYSIGIIESGTEYLSVYEKELVLQSNSIVIINPYDVHANRSFDDDIMNYKSMYINAEIMKFYCKKFNIQYTPWFQQAPIDDAYLYKSILNFYNYQTQEYLSLMMCHLLNKYAVEKPATISVKPINAIEEAKQYLKQHLSVEVSIEKMAEMYKMSKYSFIRSFKNQTGITPLSYLLVHRISQSKKLIAQGMPITHVALETGFYDHSHFNHYFKKYTGINPMHYKKGLTIE